MVTVIACYRHSHQSGPTQFAPFWRYNIQKRLACIYIKVTKYVIKASVIHIIEQWLILTPVNGSRSTVGWLVMGLTALGDSISVYIRPSPKRRRKRKERIDESKNVQPTPTRTYCKRSRPLSYCTPNCRTPRH